MTKPCARTYPDWICQKCGNRLGQPIRLSTWHDGDPNDPNDKCGWCGSRESLTEPRDFGYPEWREALKGVEKLGEGR